MKIMKEKTIEIKFYQVDNVCYRNQMYDVRMSVILTPLDQRLLKMTLQSNKCKLLHVHNYTFQYYMYGLTLLFYNCIQYLNNNSFILL